MFFLKKNFHFVFYILYSFDEFELVIIFKSKAGHYLPLVIRFDLTQIESISNEFQTFQTDKINSNQVDDE